MRKKNLTGSSLNKVMVNLVELEKELASDLAINEFSDRCMVIDRHINVDLQNHVAATEEVISVLESARSYIHMAMNLLECNNDNDEPPVPDYPSGPCVPYEQPYLGRDSQGTEDSGGPGSEFVPVTPPDLGEKPLPPFPNPDAVDPPPPKDPDDFRKELECVLNKHSMENGSDTPDFILAIYLVNCLKAFDVAVKQRGTWYTGAHGPVPS